MLSQFLDSYETIENEMGKIVKFCGSWVVTEAGIGCPDACYFITTNMLKASFMDWQRHMSEKSWCDMEDFKAAFTFATAR